MTNINWLNAVSGDFNTGTNWSGGTVPGASDDANLGVLGGTPYTVTEGSTAVEYVHTLHVAANATLDIGLSGVTRADCGLVVMARRAGWSRSASKAPSLDNRKISASCLAKAS